MVEPVRHRNRTGFALVAVIGCLVAASLILATVVRTAAVGYRAAKTEAWQIQAVWLAESGLQRAVWQLHSNADYVGETWTLSAQELGGSHGAVVQIEVETPAGQPERRLVRARAEYPNDPQHRVRHTKEIWVEVPAASHSRSRIRQNTAEFAQPRALLPGRPKSGDFGYQRHDRRGRFRQTSQSLATSATTRHDRRV